MVNFDFTFSRIPEIYFGAGKFKQLPDIIRKFGSNIIIVTGSSSFHASVYYKQFIDTLDQYEIKYSEKSTSHEPSPDFIDSITNQFKDQSIDLVVGIGGGSAIDAGKAISAMLLKEGSVKQYLEGFETIKHNGVKIPYIAVPTTSGTGSEATKNAVLSEIGENGFKSSLRHDNLVPDISLIDPELSLSCPPDITAACGMDAFTQLLEAYVSKKASPMTDSLALKGIEHFNTGFISSFTNGSSDISARSNMSYASLISGIVLANSGLGVVHGFASAIGGYYNIPHGVICGTLLGEATKKNISVMLTNPEQYKTALKKYAEVGIILSGQNSISIKEGCHNLINTIDSFIKRTSISKLSAYGITSSDISNIIEKTLNKNSPVNLNKEQLSEILEQRI